MGPNTQVIKRSFPREQRLTRGVEIARVRQEGKRVRTAHLDVRATASLYASARVGFVVPKYKHSSVDRNRLKRRLRELVRLEWLPMLPPVDVVMRVTPPAYVRDFDALRTELRVAGQRLSKLTFPELLVDTGLTAMREAIPETNSTTGDTPASPAP